jgi:hypothetical protein
MTKLYVVPLLLLTMPVAAQSLTPQVISPGGGYISGSGGSLSFTLGETAVGSFIGTAGSLTQGFQPTVTASIPLPLDFLTVTAKLVDNKTLLSWTTTFEVNTHYFIIERSIDGQSFNPIATVAALDPVNTSSDNTYQAIDSLPLSGTDYYRIKEVDQNGQATYSPIVSVKINTGLICMVYPNPATDQVNISINSNVAVQATIVMYNLSGQLIVSKPVYLSSGQNQFGLNIADKPTGIYIIKILGLDGLPTYSILVSPR